MSRLDGFHPSVLGFNYPAFTGFLLLHAVAVTDAAAAAVAFKRYMRLFSVQPPLLLCASEGNRTKWKFPVLQWWPLLLAPPLHIWSCATPLQPTTPFKKQDPPIKWLCLVLVIEVRVRATVQFRVCQSEVGFVCSLGGSAAPETQLREGNNYCKIYGWQLQQRKSLHHKKKARNFPDNKRIPQHSRMYLLYSVGTIAQDTIQYFPLINNFLRETNKKKCLIKMQSLEKLQ